MQKSGGAAIPMKKYEKIEFEVGDQEVLDSMSTQKPMQPFAEEAITFLNMLSDTIRKIPELENMSDAAAFAFWCRKAGMSQKRKENENNLQHSLGRGTVLQFVPSNVPALFAFSMAAAILAGNCVILRLSSKKSRSGNGIIKSLKQVLLRMPEWKGRIVLLRYPHCKEITDELSKVCDVRVIWGGDASVKEIRKSEMPPRAVELTFADRGSAALIKASEIINSEDLSDVVRNFYNDTYSIDQNACSSPSIIYWLGSEPEVETAREKFWEQLHRCVETKYTLEPALALKKWEQAAYIGALSQGNRIFRKDNRIISVMISELQKGCWNYSLPGGFFIEAFGEGLSGMLPILTEHCQTITAHGISSTEITDFLIANRVSGVDRVVQLGHALDFSLTWDGFDLIRSMSRRIDIL